MPYFVNKNFLLSLSLLLLLLIFQKTEAAFGIDLEPPVTKILTAKPLEFSVSDIGGSGVKETYYCSDMEGVCVPNILLSSALRVNITNPYLRYFSVDNFFNKEAVKMYLNFSNNGGFNISNENEDDIDEISSEPLVVPEQPLAPVNLISNPNFEIADGNEPTDWVKGSWNSSAVFEFPSLGLNGTNGAKVTLESETGDAKWAFNRVSVTPGSEYEFYDHFMSDVYTYVTAEYEKNDGSLIYSDLAMVGPTVEFQKFTANIIAPQDVKAASIFHLINQSGSLVVDGFYLGTASGNNVLPLLVLADNLISNFSFEEISGSLPTGFRKGNWGDNTASFFYPVAGHTGKSAAQVGLTQKTTGDAKWYFDPISVEPGKTYTFSDYYKSDVPTYITLQYTLTDGPFIYQDIATPAVSLDWQKVEVDFTAPLNAASVTVFHLINQIGVLTVDDYYLAETL